MELGFDAKRLFCNFTGLGNYSRTLVGNIQRYHPEHRLHLYTPKIRQIEQTKPFLDEKLYNVRQPSCRLNKLWRSWGMIKDFRRDKIDLFHGLSHEIPFGMNKSGIKSVVSIHDLIFKVYPETYTSIDRNIYDLKFRYACKNADRILAISESTRHDIIKYYRVDEGKIDVAYQSCSPMLNIGVEQQESFDVKSHYNLPDDYILYVGTVEKRKNLKTLLSALASMETIDRPALVVVGKGRSYKAECKDMVINSGLQSSVFWLDYLWENDHLRSLYRHATIFVYPSLYEGFGLPVAEALLNKTPVITSNISSLPEAGGPSSAYIDPMSQSELGNAIKKLLGSKDLREKMAREGFDYANKKFDPKETTQKVVEIYHKTIEG